MNILVFSWRGPGHPNAGGAEVSTHEHAKGWVKAGHCVTLFTSSFKGGKKEELVDGVEIKRAGRQVLGVQFEALKWYLFKPHKTFNLVIDQFHGLPFFTPLFIKIKKMAFIHEVTKEVWKYNTWSRPLNFIPSILGPFLEPLIFKIFYKGVPFMTVSDSTKKDLIEWGIPADNITVIHNGFSHPKIGRLPSKEKKNTAIFLGAIAKDKGIEDALRVFSEINKKANNWQFWVVGKAESHYQDYLKNLAKNLGLENRLKFWGYVSEMKKFELLAKAHILVNPSIREGWGLVVIEAAAVGTPTIGYNVPGLRDSILDGKTGLLCDIKPEALVSKIQYLLDNTKLYQSLSANCLKWSRNFSWEKSVNASLKLLETILSSKLTNKGAHDRL